MTNTETVSTERLALAEEIIKRWAQWIVHVSADMDEPEWPTASAYSVANDRDFVLSVLSASRTQEPAEWQVEALAYDWEYTDPKTGHWSYARTPERAERLQAQGVKLTPVYTIEAVRKEQARAASIPAPERSKEEWQVWAQAALNQCRLAFGGMVSVQSAIDRLDSEPPNPAPVPHKEGDAEDEAYKIGKRDGYEQAVQDIDLRTGGDGEYRFCSDHDPDRHTPTPAHMIERIVDRFAAAPAPVPVPLEDGQVEIIEQSDTPDGGTALTLRQYDQETVVVAYFPPVLPPVPVPVPVPVMITDAARDVLAERKRQVEKEGWTPEHDDEHTQGQMAGAAACYALTGISHWGRDQAIASLWPWDDKWWKRADTRRNLVKAGALILAEIERLDRAALSKPGEQG